MSKSNPPMNTPLRTPEPSRRMGLLSLLALGLLSLAPLAQAQSNGNPPERIAYQGFLTDNTGTPLATNGTRNFNLTLKICDAATAGNTLWAETQTATVDRGNVSLMLGEGAVLSPYGHSLVGVFATNATASDRYLEITIRGIGVSGADVTMTPRLRWVTAPYAFVSTYANNLANASGSNILVTGSTALTANANLNVNGNIGIGTAATGNKLQIYGGLIYCDQPDATDNTGIGGVMAGSDFWRIHGAGSNNDGTLYIDTGDDANEPIVFRQNSGSPMGVYTPYERMRIAANGYLGIGTTSPMAPLQISAKNNNDPAANGLYVYNPNNSAGQYAIIAARTAGGSAGCPYFSMDVAGVNGWSMGIDNSDGQKFKIMNSWNFGSNTKLTIQTDGNVLFSGSLYAPAFNGANAVWNQLKDTSGQDRPWYLRHSDGNDYLNFGSNGGNLYLRRNNDSANVMTLTTGGNVGIGTTSPGDKLTVAGNASFNGAYVGSGISTGFYYDGNLALRSGGAHYFQNAGGANTWMFINSGGNVGIGTTDPQQKLHVNSWIRTDGGIQCIKNGSEARFTVRESVTGGNNGGIALSLYNGSQNANYWRDAIYDGDSNWDYYSDRRLKKDITGAEPMLDKLMQVEFVRYHWNEDASTNKLKLGVIAQQLQPIFPLMVKSGVEPNSKEERLTVAYTEFATVACRSIQELKLRMDAELAAKDAKIKSLEAKVARLAELERKSAKLEQMENKMAAMEQILSRLSEQSTRPRSTQAALHLNDN